MRIYRVGGSVRDMLLGREPKDNDYVVVGATVDEFKAEFPTAEPIGKSFPVFLVKEGEFQGEFAFARIERKVGAGHQGFEVVADTSVTLEQDLSRRDLTINAMALPAYGTECAEGELQDKVIDPFGGRIDLKERRLRHVSDAFREDPLRVFRLARFAAQLGFAVAPETVEMARSIPDEELYALSGERVGEETRKAMRSPNPPYYFEVLKDLGGPLRCWFPELLQLIGTPAGPRPHHCELDAFVHTMMVLDLASAPKADTFGSEEVQEVVRWAALTHDLGKGVTPREEWPSHRMHEERGVVLVERFYDRLKMPTIFKEAAKVACEEHLRVHRFLEMGKGKMVDLIRHADRTRLGAEGLAAVALADALGRDAVMKRVEGPKALLIAAQAARDESGHPIPLALKGEHIGLHIRARKGTAVKKALSAAGML